MEGPDEGAEAEGGAEEGKGAPAVGAKVGDTEGEAAEEPPQSIGQLRLVSRGSTHTPSPQQPW